MPQLGALDSFDDRQAWADATVSRHREAAGRGECTLTTLASELFGPDEESRTSLSEGFLRWKDVLQDGLARMCSRGDLHPGANLDDLAYGLLAALQGCWHTHCRDGRLMGPAGPG